MSEMKSQKILGVFSLAMINVAAIVSLRNFPLLASYGWASIYYYLIAAVIFLIPSALVCAELAACWPGSGGLYHWVKEAFGRKIAFIAIWFSWMISIAWFPTILSFTAATFAYVYDPTLSNNPYYMLTVMLSVFWLATFVNFLGIKTSSLISNIGVLLGTVIPTILIILLAAYWFGTQPTESIPLINTHETFSYWSLSHWVFLAGVILGFEGMEVTAFHVQNAKNPQRDFPRALILSTVLILLVSMAGTLAIATVLTPNEIHIVSGVMQVFERFLSNFGLEKAVPLLAIILVIGSLAGINTWVIGPAKGIFAAQEDGFLPKWLHYKNKRDVPVATLIFQAVISSLLAFVYLWMPSVQSSYWFLTALTTQVALVMYCLIFLSLIVLRRRHPHRERAFQIPGGQVGLYLITGLGLLCCVLVFGLSFIPPEDFDMGIGYHWVLSGGLLFLSLPAIIVVAKK